MVTAIVILLVFVALPFIWPHRWLVREGHKYLLRWPLLGGDGLKRAPGGNVAEGETPRFLGRLGENYFLHYICMSDGPNVHSHPWDAKALILWGRYRDTRYYRTLDVTKDGGMGWGQAHVNEYGPGDVNYIDGRCYHTLELLTPFVITLCWTSKKHGKGWFFKVGDKLVNASGRGPAAYDEASNVK